MAFPGCQPQLLCTVLHSPGNSEMSSLNPVFLSNGSLSSCQLSGALARPTASASAADAWMPTFLGCDGEHTRSPGWGYLERFRLAATPGAWLSGECQEAKNLLSFSMRTGGQGV